MTHRRPAHTKRILQFVAGPQTQVFYACTEHTNTLRTGEVSNFMLHPAHALQEVGPSERDNASVVCDFCEP